jgi:hypothetical protein
MVLRYKLLMIHLREVTTLTLLTSVMKKVNITCQLNKDNGGFQNVYQDVSIPTLLQSQWSQLLVSKQFNNVTACHSGHFISQLSYKVHT